MKESTVILRPVIPEGVELVLTMKEAQYLRDILGGICGTRPQLNTDIFRKLTDLGFKCNTGNILSIRKLPADYTIEVNWSQK